MLTSSNLSKQKKNISFKDTFHISIKISYVTPLWPSIVLQVCKNFKQ